MRNIDFIYMINLDQRPEKWESSLNQFALYGIEPYRFSAVNGWKLSLEQILDVGVLFTLGMQGGFWATTFRKKQENEPSFPKIKDGHCGLSYPFQGDFIWEQQILGTFGQVYFGHCMERGTIGIALSHISILKDAYDSGYETIWILEDDVEIVSDPRILSERIDELDALTHKKWDILFTDRDIRNEKGDYIPACCAAKRPDFISQNDFALKREISPNLRKIGARYGAHSMILRRCGIEKLLRFFEAHQIFLPYDMEYTLPEDIQLFTTQNDIVTNLINALSDNGHPRYLDDK